MDLAYSQIGGLFSPPICDCDCICITLHGTNVLPLHVRTNSLPGLVLDVQLVPILEKGEAGQVFVHLQKLAELVQNVSIAQKVTPPFGNVLLERRLNLPKHVAQLLLILPTHEGGILARQAIDNMGNVLIVFRLPHVAQNLPQLGALQGRKVRDALLLELEQNLVINAGGNLGALLGLELGQPLVKVINLLVGIVRQFSGRVLIGGLVAVNQDELLVTTGRTCHRRLIHTQAHLVPASVAMRPLIVVRRIIPGGGRVLILEVLIHQLVALKGSRSLGAGSFFKPPLLDIVQDRQDTPRLGFYRPSPVGPPLDVLLDVVVIKQYAARAKVIVHEPPIRLYFTNLGGETVSLLLGGPELHVTRRVLHLFSKSLYLCLELLNISFFIRHLGHLLDVEGIERRTRLRVNRLGRFGFGTGYVAHVLFIWYKKGGFKWGSGT